jgi:hypothetical protein
MAVLESIEIYHHAPLWPGIIAVAVGEIIIVLVLRAHYTMDVITGAFAAWLAADLARHCAPFVDGWLKYTQCQRRVFLNQLYSNSFSEISGRDLMDELRWT